MNKEKIQNINTSPLEKTATKFDCSTRKKQQLTLCSSNHPSDVAELVEDIPDDAMEHSIDRRAEGSLRRCEKKVMKNFSFFFRFMVVVMMMLINTLHDGVMAQGSEATDRDALLATKSEWTDFGSANMTSWSALTMPCSPEWRYVFCSNSRVTQMDLSAKGIYGKIATDIGRLDQLIILEFSLNYNLVGTIPSQLGLLTNLETLGLSGTKLTGTIISQLGSLNKLIDLKLDFNRLTGTIPSQLVLLTNLQYLLLSLNHLNSTIPSQLGFMIKLNYLNIFDNLLTGTIPSQLGLLTNLSALILSVNKLSGTIPFQLGLLTSLTTLDLSSNILTGAIPSQLGMPNLQYLFLLGNELSATMPSRLGLSTNLIYLDLSINQLSGTIPTHMGLLSKLLKLFLPRNKLSGAVPSQLGLLTDMFQLNMESNRLTHTIPCQLGLLTDLIYLSIHHNDLTGTIPTYLALLDSMDGLLLHNNHLVGTIPSHLCLLTNLGELDLNYNQLTGIIPPQLVLMIKLRVLRLGSNRLNGNLPSRLELLTNFRLLSIGSNKFTGTIPSELGLLTQLYGLNLHNNRFSGSIPSNIGRLSSLQDMTLQNNAFTSSLPSEIGKFSGLYELHVNNNKFNSTLPSELGLIPYLSAIYLLDNSFTGTLPSEFGRFSYLSTFYANVNTFNGTLPTSWVNFPRLNNVDITNSGLTCTFCDPVHFWNIVTNADSFVITQQPITSLGSEGVIAVAPVVQIINYVRCSQETCHCVTIGCCPDCLIYSPAVLLPSYVVTATIQPFNKILPGSLTGNSVGSIQGIASFESLQFIGQPNVSYTITFSAPGLVPSSTIPLTVAPCDVRQRYSSQSRIDPYSCICDVGFYMNPVGKQCILCPPGSYKNTSSIEDDRINANACQSCPKLRGLECSGGNMVNVLPGFWFSSLNVVESCPGGNRACPGTNFSLSSYSLSSTKQCSTGYEGPACGACAEGFSSSEGFKCSECLPTGLNVFIYFILFLVGTGFVYWLVSSNSKSSYPSSDQSDIGAVAKVLLNFQGLFYLGELSANWSSISKSLFSTSGKAGLTFNFLSFDCDSKMTHYDKMVLIYIMPLIVTGVVAVIYAINHIFKGKTFSESKNGFQFTLMIALSLIHPYLFKQSITMFQCDSVAGEKYLHADYSVTCAGGEYASFVAASVVFLVIYIFGAMGLFFYRLHHNAQDGKLFDSTSSSNSKYAYFIQGYKQESYFWEGAVLLRKMLLVLFAATVSSFLQIFIAFGILYISWHGTLHFMPFISVAVNRLESITLIALIVTSFLGAIFLSTSDADTTWTTVVLVMVNIGVSVFLLWNVAIRVLPMLKGFLGGREAGKSSQAKEMAPFKF